LGISFVKVSFSYLTNKDNCNEVKKFTIYYAVGKAFKGGGGL